MKKSIAFLVLMFASQVALGDFLWPRGNEFTVTVQDFTFETNSPSQYESLSSQRAEAIGQKFKIFLNNNRDALVLINNEEGENTTCFKRINYFDCAEKDSEVEVKAFLEINLKRLVGLRIEAKSPNWDNEGFSTATMLLSIP